VIWVKLSSSGNGSSPHTVNLVADTLSGMQILADFSCGFAEQKLVLINGVEDNYRLDVPEPSHPNPNLSRYSHTSFEQRPYDVAGLDKFFFDTFRVPSNISQGLFVIALDPLGVNNNDEFSIVKGPNYVSYGKNIYTIPIVDMKKNTGWFHTGGIYSIALDKLTRFNNTKVNDAESLLSYIQSSDEESVFDFGTTDDTRVDFAAIAVCQKPVTITGLTFFNTNAELIYQTKGLNTINCNERNTGIFNPCNPIKGDTSCETSLPVACFYDRGLSVPQTFDGAYWSGGDVALTSPRRGDSFKTISDVDAYCRTEFGNLWRTASFHDGGGKKPLTSSVPIVGPTGRVWIDIKDQPYGTCWTRDIETREAHP